MAGGNRIIRLHSKYRYPQRRKRFTHQQENVSLLELEFLRAEYGHPIAAASDPVVEVPCDNTEATATVRGTLRTRCSEFDQFRLADCGGPAVQHHAGALVRSWDRQHCSQSMRDDPVPAAIAASTLMELTCQPLFSRRPGSEPGHQHDRHRTRHRSLAYQDRWPLISEFL